LLYPIFGFATYDKTEADNANKEIKEYLKVLNKYLEGKTYAVGNSITLADVELFNAIRGYFSFVIVEEQRKNLYPNITKWFTGLSTNESFLKAFGRTVLCKVPQKAPKVEKPKEEPKKKEESKPKAEKKETGEGDEEEGSKKKKNALDLLPPSSFNFDDFKKAFLNTDKVVALNDFWKNIDTNGYSFWFTQYQKLPSEGKVLFKTNNFAGIYLQKLDHFRKYCFSAFGVYGVEGDYEIRGVWVWRGTDIPEQIKEHDNYEYTTFKKLDPLNNAADKQLITDYWLNL
jgi:elongation factor 1-gamma